MSEEADDRRHATTIPKPVAPRGRTRVSAPKTPASGRSRRDGRQTARVMTDGGEHIDVDVDRVVVSRVSTHVYHLPTRGGDPDDTAVRCGRAPDFARIVETERAVRAGRTLCHYCDPAADTARNGMAKVLVETDPDAIPDGGVVTCPACGHDSTTVYRCDDCGHDLADGGDSGGWW